jgi:hypothetical protein
VTSVTYLNFTPLFFALILASLIDSTSTITDGPFKSRQASTLYFAL